MGRGEDGDRDGADGECGTDGHAPSAPGGAHAVYGVVVGAPQPVQRDRLAVGVRVVGEDAGEGLADDRAGQPLTGVLSEQPLHDLRQRPGPRRAAHREPVHALQRRLRTAPVAERRVPLDQGVEDRAERPQVGGGADAFVAGLLRRGVRRGGDARGEGGAREAEAGEDDPALVAHEDLAGAEFAVGDALAVRGLQDVEQFESDAGGPDVVERALLGEELAERGAVDPVGDGPQGAAVLDGVDDRGDPGGGEQHHGLGGAQDTGGGPAGALPVRGGGEGHLCEEDGSFGDRVLAVPGDPIGLAERDLHGPVSAGHHLVRGDMRLDHGHPSLNP